MAKLLVKNESLAPFAIDLKPGCNRLGRAEENDFVLPHDSVSGAHCEVWLTEEAVLVRDLESRNGTFIDEQRVSEAQLFEGQTLRLGDIEMVLAEPPVRVAIPQWREPPRQAQQTYMADGTPCCMRHEGVAATFECTQCHHDFCSHCVRELKIAGGLPHRYCPDCNAQCDRLTAV